MDTKKIQAKLNELGYDAGPVDGDAGGRTTKAILHFQEDHNLLQDGKVGPLTEKALADAKPHTDPDLISFRAPAKGSPKATNWPRQKDCISFYGPQGGPKATAGTVHLVAPMRIAWARDQRISSFKCHEKVAAAMTTIFAETVAHYGEDKWRELGLDLFGGCYNLRAMRGGTAYSMHSWGIAVDIDPERNQLKWSRNAVPGRRPAAQMAKAEYEAFWNIVESAGATSLGRVRDFDWMHFQFASL